LRDLRATRNNECHELLVPGGTAHPLLARSDHWHPSPCDKEFKLGAKIGASQRYRLIPWLVLAFGDGLHGLLRLSLQRTFW
jgi:hypothetical protein